MDQQKLDIFEQLPTFHRQLCERRDCTRHLAGLAKQKAEGAGTAELMSKMSQFEQWRSTILPHYPVMKEWFGHYKECFNISSQGRSELDAYIDRTLCPLASGIFEYEPTFPCTFKQRCFSSLSSLDVLKDDISMENFDDEQAP